MRIELREARERDKADLRAELRLRDNRIEELQRELRSARGAHVIKRDRLKPIRKRLGGAVACCRETGFRI